MHKRCNIVSAPLIFGVAALVLFPVVEVRSQDKVNARSNVPSLVSADAGKPTTLLIALEKHFETRKFARYGCLLVVDPAKALPMTQALPLTDAPEEDISLDFIAQSFDRFIATSGPITALVPARMVLLNPSPAPPNIYQGLDAASRMRLFMDTLTPSQWQQLGGVSGLGADALSDQQRPLFLSLLPDPFCIRRAAMEEGTYRWDDAQARVLTAEVREKIRLRLNLASEIRPIPSELGQGITLLGDSAHRQGTSFLTLDDAANAAQSAGRVGRESYGVVLRAEVTNTQKPSDLDFDLPSLAAPVALKPEGTSGRGLTVGELVRRAGAAAHLELYADRRIAALPVWTLGATAPAKNLLRVLCLSVTGTFRRVGSALVLTDDVVGLGTRLAVQQDWLEDARAQQEEMLEALQDHPLSKPLLASLSFPSGDPLATDAVTVGKILAGYGRIYSGDYRVTLGVLPAARRMVFQNYIDNALRQEQPVRTDAVALNVNLRMAYLVPGEGEVAALQPDLGSLPGFVQPSASELIGVTPALATRLKPVNLTGFTNHVLCVAPKTDREAVRVVDAAKAGGFQKVWVRLPADGNTSFLVAAINRGKMKGVAVFAVVPLFRQQSSLPDADQNVQGQTSAAYDAALLRSAVGRRGQKLPFDVSQDDWKLPSAACLDDQSKRLVKLASIPGLAGIVLRDTAAPGYETAMPPRRGDLSPFSHLVGTASRDMGYTEGLRLAFLRLYGLDPVDITASQPSAGSNWSLPFFPADAQGSQQWVAFRGEINARHMAALFAVLRPLNPHMPLLIGERSGTTTWFGSWHKPQALPLYDLGPFSLPIVLQARSVSGQIWKNVAVTNENISSSDYAQYVQGLLPSHGMGNRWNGVVFDLSAFPVDKATLLVKDCFEQAAPRKP